MMPLLRGAIGALLLAISAQPAHAWGWQAHRLVAEIAWEHLTPRARAQAQELIGVDSGEAAIWADLVVRTRRETAPWHYINSPLGAPSYVPARDCPDGACVAARIHHFARVLADKEVAPPLRAEALRFLIHFVGDIHQPLHAGFAEDRGGNEVWATIGGRTERLHGWWDFGLFERAWPDARAAAAEIRAALTPEKLQRWQAERSPDAWANESRRIVIDVVYRGAAGTNTKATPIVLPPAYAEAARAVIAERILTAGVRLAALLNAALP